MKPDIPRCDGDNPPSGPSSAPMAVTWWAWLGTDEPPLAVGRSPEHAREQLGAEVLRYFKEHADPLPEDPEARAEADLGSRVPSALLSGSADDERTAFLAWRFVSCLAPEEALRRWRRAFPRAEAGADPLASA